MIRTKKTILFAFSALVAITLLVQSGCKPAATEEVAKKETTNSSTVSESASTSGTASGSGKATSSNADGDADSGKPATAEPETALVPPATESKEEAAVAEPTAEEAKVAETKSEAVVISGDLNSVDWSSMVGQEITITGDLIVMDNFDLARRGQVKVARSRLYVPTSGIDPNDADPNGNSFEGGSNVAKVAKEQKSNNEATIILDDGSAKQNIFPPTLFPNLGKTHPTVRVGSVVKGVSGKLVKAGNNLLLVAKQPLQWTPAERPKRPSVGEAVVTVSSFNVLNYFTTIDDESNDARGADSESELIRQEAKIVSAIVTLNADVIGLMEIENNLEAENRLIAALNKEIGKEVFKGCGLPEGINTAPGGSDAIRVGIIYRADRVTPVGDVSMISDVAFKKARTPIVQSFKSKTAGSPFAVIVNHFKSKSSSRADAANKNKGDGQGAYNATRRTQSLAICKYVDEQMEGGKNPRILVIGDLNAYDQEDPIDAMRAKGLVDLRERYEDASSAADDGRHYSYNFRSQSGSMDHAMATESMAADVTGIATWHINADEPRFLDYNEEYNPKALYEANPFRSSDHDPVLIGIKN